MNRFLWRNIDSRGPAECWPWLRATTKDGYGRVKVDGKLRLAHCVVWEQTHGLSARGRVVRHDCDNPVCCNPGHLRIGSQADNNRDKAVRGRSSHAKGNAVLSPAQVREIREARQQRRGTQEQIGALFGVSRQAVSAIERGKTWTDV